MNVLIITRTDDGHAAAVTWALRRRGVNVRLLLFSDFPQKLSVTYNGASNAFTIADANGPFPARWDVVWDRRAGHCSPAPHFHASDRRMARQIGDIFMRSLAQGISDQGIWLNPFGAGLRAEDKVYQLSVARSVGFMIPATVISNDPQRIREFVQGEGECIVKPLRPMTWDAPGRIVSVGTSRISLSQLSDDESVAICPMIYQREIRKSKEFRVVYLGGVIICVELIPSSPSSELDWRYYGYRNLVAKPSCVGSLLKEQISGFMDKCGLRCGSFDFIMDDAENVYFIEVNQQGQFLWLEEINPQLKMLSPFSNFVTSVGAAVTIDESLDDFNSEGGWQAFQNEMGAQHVVPFEPEQNGIYKE